MATLNKVMLIGRLGQDPTNKNVNGLSITSFTLATTHPDKDKKPVTDWHRVVSFGKLADIAAKYLSKGREAYIEGRLQTRQYEKDGKTQYITEIIAEEIQFLGGGEKKETQGDRGAQYQQPYNSPAPAPGSYDSDIPF